MPPLTLFSTYFSVDPRSLDKAGLLDPFLDVDLPLFIDPLLLVKSSNSVIATDGVDEFRVYFEQLVRLLAMAEREDDPAWKAAERNLSLREPPENGLGYGKRGRSGSSRPRRVRAQVLRTTKQIINLGSKDPEMISLMGFFEEDVGSDTISDLTTRAIAKQLAEVTSSFCRQQNIATDYIQDNIRLPSYIDVKGIRKPIVLIPKDIVRSLPVTDSWSDVWEATEHNRELRDRVNKLLGGIAAPTVAQQKEAIRKAALQSSIVFDQFLLAVQRAATSYDPNDDILGYYTLRDLLLAQPLSFRPAKYDTRKGPEVIHQVILDALDAFKHHVEHGNLWEALWAGNQPKWERASQLIFFAIADAFCRAHDIDISGEPNMGGGPVDFKFSTGYAARVLVEMKRSTGTVESGYSKQLEKYKTIAKMEYGIFVVIDYGGDSKKIEAITKMQADTRAQGRRASDIVVIDARKKNSPSKLH